MGLFSMFSKAEKPFHDPWAAREAWRYEAPFKPNSRLFGCVLPSLGCLERPGPRHPTKLTSAALDGRAWQLSDAVEACAGGHGGLLGL